jgi:hypothetical protein
MGFGRWCRVCKQNVGERGNIEQRTKLFQTIMMIGMSAGSMALSVFLMQAYVREEIAPNYDNLVYIGFIFEYCAALLVGLIGYWLLARQWEGYQEHGFLKILHYITIVLISTIIPHGDFLLSLGYKQIGFLNKGVEEKIPDGFEIHSESNNLKGYLSNSTRGGHFYFMLIGHFRCLLILIRQSLLISFYSIALFNFSPIAQRSAPLIMMFFAAYAGFCLLMMLKMLLEFIRIPKFKCCEKLCKKKKSRAYSDLLLRDDDYDNINIL